MIGLLIAAPSQRDVILHRGVVGHAVDAIIVELADFDAVLVRSKMSLHLK